MVPVIIGLSLAAGALFLFWLFTHKSTQPTPGPGQQVSWMDRIQNLLGIGESMASKGIAFGSAAANGVYTVGNKAIDLNTQLLTQGVNLGGKALNAGAGLALNVVQQGGGVIKNVAAIPPAVAAPLGDVIKSSITAPVDITKKVVGGAYSGVKSVISSIGF